MSTKPKTFAEQFCIEDASWVVRTQRNLRLLKFLFMIFVNWFKARHVRAEFQRCREQGEPFYVDRFTPPWNKND